MGGQQPEWTLQRVDNTVRIDLSRASHVSAKAADAIVGAIDEFLQDDGVTVVQVNGPVDNTNPPEGLTRVLNLLNGLTQQYRVPLVVGPDLAASLYVGPAPASA
jgi:hypothetical protein